MVVVEVVATTKTVVVEQVVLAAAVLELYIPAEQLPAER
jgi:hypothetical protein